MEKSLESSKTWEQKQIYAQFLHSSALYGLYQMLLAPEKIPDGRKKEQANWVLKNTNMDDLRKALQQSITNSQITFSKIENPNEEIQALKKQLDEMSKNISEEK